VAQPGADDTLPCGSMRACVVLLPTNNAWDVLSWDGRSSREAPESLYQAIATASGATPEGVSCGSPGICSMLESAAPAPDDTPDVALNGVSYVDATCMAVGAYPDAAGTAQTVAEQHR
jgi:hypothetical protein